VASAEEVSEGGAEEDEAEVVVEGTSVFSFRGDIATLERAVNSHTIFPEQAVVEVEIMGVVRLLEDPGSHHTADSRDKEEDMSHSKQEVVEGTANQWAQVEAFNNKEVLLVTVSQIVTEAKAVSQGVTEARVVSHLVMLAKVVSQLILEARAYRVTVVVEVDSKMITVVADTIKHHRIATPSLWEVEDITSQRARLPLEDMDNRTVMHNKELEGQVTRHPRVFIINSKVDIQEAARMDNREEEEVLLAVMGHHLEEEVGQEDIPSIEKTLIIYV